MLLHRVLASIISRERSNLNLTVVPTKAMQFFFSACFSELLAVLFSAVLLRCTFVYILLALLGNTSSVAGCTFFIWENFQ